MKIFFPDNIFTELIKKSIDEKVAAQISLLASSLITGEVLKNSGSVGLIPTMDLLRHKDLYVSRSFGISFEESLCNSYLYFQAHGKEIKELSLTGDVSSNEAIGGKLILKELYGVDAQINILTPGQNIEDRSLLSVGNGNFENDKFLEGISFAEEIIEVLSLPYVNFILVSSEETSLKEFRQSIGDIQLKIYNSSENENFGGQFSAKAKEKIKESISSFVCNLDEQDLDGVDQLLRLAFYHEIIPEIIEVKFV